MRLTTPGYSRPRPVVTGPATQTSIEPALERADTDVRTGSSWISHGAAIAVSVIGVFVLAGWVFDAVALKSVVPGLRVMVPNTALCFLLAGVALSLTQRDGSAHSLRVVAARCAAWVIILFGAASLVEYLLGMRFGLERFIFDPPSEEGPYAGRMSPQTALNFVLVGSALVMLRSPSRRAGAVADSLSLSVMAISWLALVGFAYDISRLYDVPRYPGLALHSAAAFFILSTGLVCSHGDAVGGRLMSSSESGGLLRRFIPLALVLPVALVWIRRAGEQLGWYDRPFGLALLTIAFTVALIGVIGSNARALHQMERKRRLAEVALRSAHDELEKRVAERTAELATVNETLHREIVQRKEAQDELATLLAREHVARRRAEEADRVKEEFLATVSHELRAPLNSILGWIHLVRENALGDTGHERAMATIERSARVQKQLVEDLIDASRTTSGKLHLNMHPVEIMQVVQTAVEAARPTASAKNVSITLDILFLAGVVMGDADRLQQIIWNLVANAIKFTPAGGSVHLSARRVESMIEIAVSDTGPGIEPEFLPFVFDRFRQGNGSMTRTHGGLGLGLSIARHLVELHGGTIRAESEGGGKGSTFTVLLPASVSAPGGSTGVTVRHDRGSAHELPSSIRVLVVDDDSDSRELVKTILQHSGARVDAVASSAEATEHLMKRQPSEQFDVLVCDVGMPEEDGYTFMRRVRACEKPEIRTTPAIALTGYVGPEDRARATAAGFQLHVAKPLDPAQLLAAIRSLVSGRPSADAGS